LAIREYERRKIALSTALSCGMTNVINLRMARKHAARDEAAHSAAESRLSHGISKTERNHTAADRESSRRLLDQHRIDAGDRR
jgi:uncharacterized protein DUF4169